MLMHIRELFTKWRGSRAWFQLPQNPSGNKFIKGLEEGLAGEGELDLRRLKAAVSSDFFLWEVYHWEFIEVLFNRMKLSKGLVRELGQVWKSHILFWNSVRVCRIVSCTPHPNFRGVPPGVHFWICVGRYYLCKDKAVRLLAVAFSPNPDWRLSKHSQNSGGLTSRDNALGFPAFGIPENSSNKPPSPPPKKKKAVLKISPPNLRRKNPS